MLDWLGSNWRVVLIPLAIFFATIIVLFWLRRRALETLQRWAGRSRWPADDILIRAIEAPSLIWGLILSTYIGLMVSVVPEEWKGPSGKLLWSLFLLSMTLSVVNISIELIGYYSPRARIPQRTIALLKNLARIIFVTVAFLILLDIWGVPTTPLLILIAIVVLVAVLAFRDAVPNFLAGFQLSASDQVKVGDFIKLETGEEGYVLDISWRTTRIETLDESVLMIPNSRLAGQKVINYGRPLKKASSPFRFNSRTYLTELTGLKAKNLRELVDVLKVVPESVVYFHTHRFLQEYHQLLPGPSNDFAVWVSDVLGEDVLAERLAAIDTFSFPNIVALRERVVSIIEEYTSQLGLAREASPGREFHFRKSVSVVLPAPYVVHDLREFVEALRKVSPGSLYFHMFESRLRLSRGQNDFTIWFDESLGDKELAEEVARLDPYTYTMEGLRSALIQLLEKRIK